MYVIDYSNHYFKIRSNFDKKEEQHPLAVYFDKKYNSRKKIIEQKQN